MRRFMLFVAVIFLGSTSGLAAEGPLLELWAVDPLVKVFPDATPAADDAMAEVACGEHVSLQVVVRCSVLIKSLKVKVGAFTLDGGNGQSVLTPRQPRFVGYVPVDVGTARPSSERLRVPPTFYPDPLLEKSEIKLSAGSAQPIWITIPVPIDAAAGLYHGRVQVSGMANEKAMSAEFPLSVRVWPIKVEKCRLWVTNWFQIGGFTGWSQDGRFVSESEIKIDSDRYWDMLRSYARNMADHRQNVALISPLGLATFRPLADGKLDIDFSRFDRWVRIFTEEGVIGRIEGGHIGSRLKGWESQFGVGIRRVKDGKVESDKVDPSSPEADAFYSRFFPALVEHLKEKGWLDRYCQHLADEPIDMNVDSYRVMKELAAKYAPELRIIEACHSKNLTGAIQIWVPQLNFLHDDFSHYQQRQAAGDELWFYTCLGPQGEYANRFIEQPLIMTRLLHWINFRYGVTGYLHWGYNYWGNHDPFRESSIPWDGGAQNLPAGDAWIVYPGKGGPLDSIRFEAMRDGIVDHELLSMLAERDPVSAKRMAEMFVRDFDKYDIDVVRFRATRRELLERLSGASVNNQQAGTSANKTAASMPELKDGPWHWHDAGRMTVEGKGWADTEGLFRRLPSKANGVVNTSVWGLSKNSTGMCVRFLSNADRIAARWKLRSNRLEMFHMPATGVSGLDLYVRHDGQWQWIGVGRPTAFPVNQAVLASGIPEGFHEYLLYLPLYNGIDSLEVGVPEGAELREAPPRGPADAKPICFYGTSIVQGGCASRPGMAYPAIVGRRLDRPVINLGFSGSGRMEVELADLLGELDAAVYVIDCLPNMTPETIRQRFQIFVETLRRARPSTPIVLVENIQYQAGAFLPGTRNSFEAKNSAMKKVHEILLTGGVTGLFYVPCDDLLGHDGEATVDGTHATDLGFIRFADALEPILRKICGGR